MWSTASTHRRSSRGAGAGSPTGGAPQRRSPTRRPVPRTAAGPAVLTCSEGRPVLHTNLRSETARPRTTGRHRRSMPGLAARAAAIAGSTAAAALLATLPAAPAAAPAPAPATAPAASLPAAAAPVVTTPVVPLAATRPAALTLA